MLRYFKYDKLVIDDELGKIEHADEAEVILEPTNKKCLFILGMLFVNGIKIRILNEKDLNLEETNKSFSMMPYVWSKIADETFPLPDYSNVKTEMDRRVENIKRVGIKVNRIIDNPTTNKIFLICPVRNASDRQRKWIESFVKEKQEQGYIIHAPHLHTIQTDLFGGYAICKQNAEAVATSQEVDIYYDQSSTGSVFDLGVAYALHKPLKLLNNDEITFKDEDLIDNVIKYWPYQKGENLKDIEELKQLKTDLKRATKQRKQYRLIDSDGSEYLSDEPGRLGGNRRLKIYGKLDCPSAKRWIEQGKYIPNRVFFANEEIAVAAGYRPCARCMPNEYKKWKERQKTYQLVMGKVFR